MKRVWQGIVGVVFSSLWASGCLAVYDWDFQAGSGGGKGGEAGIGGGGGSGGSGAGGAGGSMNSCPGCTYGRRFGDDTQQIVFDIALAKDGSLFLSGNTKGQIALDGSNVLTPMAPVLDQGFLVKFDRMGNSEWITPPLDLDNVNSGGSHIAIVGDALAWIGSVVNVNGASGADTFVEMRDVTGGRDMTRWRKLYGTAQSDSLRSIAISPDGTRVYLAGAISNQNLTFNNCPALQPFTTTGIDQNLVVLALDAQNGNCLWGKSWGGGHHLGGSISVTTGSDGTPFVSGHIYSGTLTNSQGIQIPQAPPQDPNGIKYLATAFILKIDKTSGTLLAGRGYANGAFISMTADWSTKTIIASGGMGGNITFLGNTVIGAPDAGDSGDAIILGFDENLNEKWGRFPGGPNRQGCLSVESDGQGRVYSACVTQDKIDRDSNVNCSTDKLCGVLFTIETSTGAYIGNLTRTFGETQPAANMGLTFLTAASPSALAVAGSWTAPVRFWDDVLLDVTGNAGDFDIAVGKVDPVP